MRLAPLLILALLAILARGARRAVYRERHRRALRVRWPAPQTLAGDAPSRPALRLGIVGDSLSEMGPPVAADVAAQDWLDRGQFSRVTLVNRAVPMSRTFDWTPASATGFVRAAVASFRAEGVTHVAVRLGTNDCLHRVSPGRFRRNLGRVVRALTRAGFVVWLDHVPYMAPKPMPTRECLHRLDAYNAAISSLAGGKFVRLANTLAPGLRDPAFFLDDGIHFTEAGLIALGRSQAQTLPP